ncbi:hypothetical protein M422DRAFT_238971 [Sphaerobolus stellatus SS14]|nr:hypothetical protein M422DRAFT_238971 [Sphaerobolus stellatus SS14]
MSPSSRSRSPSRLPLHSPSRSPSRPASPATSSDSRMSSEDDIVSPRPLPLPNHVHLVLHTDSSNTNQFYLDIPIPAINAHCLRPFKYLRYLGWAILGVEGSLKPLGGTEPIDMDGPGPIPSNSTYFYTIPHALQLAVDVAVIKLRSSLPPSASSNTRIGWRDAVAERDGTCIFTSRETFEAAHIIPFVRGDEWVQFIKFVIFVTVFASREIISLFDRREIDVLQTPNPILGVNDIPARYPRAIRPNAEYPVHSRYTFQWLGTPDPFGDPDNNDAVFLEPPLVNGGAAALRRWGKNGKILKQSVSLRRPEVPTKGPSKAPSTPFDRQVAIDKRTKANREAALRAAGASGPQEESTDKDWNEDDIMLFFWGNTSVARERHAQREKEHQVIDSTSRMSPFTVAFANILSYSSEESQMPPGKPATPRPPPPSIVQQCCSGHKLYLEIPIYVVTANCLKSLKYLGYLGWSILGIQGAVHYQPHGEVDMDGPG